MRWLSYAAFFTVVTAVDGGLHYYLWARLFRDPGWSPGVRFWGGIAVLVLAILMPLGMASSRVLERSLAEPLALFAYVWMGTAFYVVLCLFAVDLLRWASGAALAAWAWLGREAPDPVRRELLAAGGAAVSGAGAVVLAGSALRSGLAEVEVHEVGVKLERLPRALSGLTVVQLTDVHVGPTIGRRFVEAVVEKANGARPDLVVITGDLVDGSVGQLAEQVAPLARLSARYGVYFVTGNHEYYSGAEAWSAHLARLGIRVLSNERVSVGDAASFDLAGVDDPTAARFTERAGREVAAATRGRDPERELLLLAHQPLAVEQAARAGAGLQLSGHTHGGQLWPWTHLVALTQPYMEGLHRHGERTQIYVSRGTGYWGPPMRLRAPAEVTKLVLSA